MTVILFFLNPYLFGSPGAEVFFSQPTNRGRGRYLENTQAKSQGLAGKGSWVQLPARRFKKSERMTPKHRKILNKDE